MATSMPSVDPWLGAELGGYRIEARVGRGSTGVVYRATHLRLGRPAALKLLTSGVAADADYRRRFDREARLAAGLDHPHIVPIYDGGYDRAVLYLAMRYIDGPNLGTLIDNDGPMPPHRLCELLAGIAEALDGAHRVGLVHRDVKPTNILIANPDQPDARRRAYLCDFGIARRITKSSALATADQFVGTLQYSAPEQIQGQDIDGRADQYSLACVVFHCLTGRLPFPVEEPAAVMVAHVSAEPPQPSRYVPTLLTGVDGILARALAKQPAQRFPDCATFLHALAAVGGHPTGPAVLSSPGPTSTTTNPTDTLIWRTGRTRSQEPVPTANETKSVATPGFVWRNIVNVVLSISFSLFGVGAFQATGSACTTVSSLGQRVDAGCLTTLIGAGISCLLTLSVPVAFWAMARRGISVHYLRLLRLPYLIPVLWLLSAAYTHNFEQLR
jgi:serine/threonine protein kinase